MLLAIMVVLFWIAVLKLAARVLGRRIPWRLALVLVLLCWLWISYVGKVF
jgi:hypothetical protein